MAERERDSPVCGDPSHGAVCRAWLPIKSVWYNPPDWGWVVDDAFAFHDPIPLDYSDKFQTSVRLSERPSYLELIAAEIAKLEPGYR